MARPGQVRVAFGAPLQLTGDDYEALTRQVEDAVRRLQNEERLNSNVKRKKSNSSAAGQEPRGTDNQT
jgi:hypothetical protein